MQPLTTASLRRCVFRAALEGSIADPGS